jgi:sulfite exporter TauE/SafE
MCGGFALHLAKSSTNGRTTLRQVLFVVGKGFTYIFLGAIAGSIGAVLLKDTAATKAIPTLRLAAGFLTLIFGLLMIGVRLPSGKVAHPSTGSGWQKGNSGCQDQSSCTSGWQNSNPVVGLIKSIFGGLLVSPTPTAALVLGMCVGYLPCPLPICMLVIAAASHSVILGMAVMAGVGLGTAPGLLGLGLFGAGVFQGANRRLAKIGLRAAGVVVIGIALITIGRATGVISGKSVINRVVPPCCSESQHR